LKVTPPVSTSLWYCRLKEDRGIEFKKTSVGGYPLKKVENNYIAEEWDNLGAHPESAAVAGVDFGDREADEHVGGAELPVDHRAVADPGASPRGLLSGQKLYKWLLTARVQCLLLAQRYPTWNRRGASDADVHLSGSMMQLRLQSPHR
jgi:hypothetical protein